MNQERPDAERWQEEVERALGRLDNDLTAIRGDMVEATARGVEEGIRRLLADDQTLDRFWRAGFERLRDQATDGASQWIGRRILTALIVALTTAGIIWLVRTGSLK